MPTIPNIALPTDTSAINPAVVRITDTIDGTRYLGSGVLISPDEVLTANHVSYKQSTINDVVTGNLATAIDVGPGYNNGYGSPGDFTGTVTHYSVANNEPNIDFSTIETDYSIIHLSKPVIGGSIMKVTPDFMGGQVHVTGYPLQPSGYGATQQDSVQTVTIDPGYPGMLDGTTLGAGSSGGPVWTIGADGSEDVVGIISAQSGTAGYDVRLTAADAAQIAAWVMQDDTTSLPPPPPLPPQPPQPPLPPEPAHVAVVLVRDTTTNADVPDTLSQPYSGPVGYLKTQFIDITSDSVNVTALTSNIFIHTGSGSDAVALLSGNNVVDGGSGSNFLTGGSGTDTFFVDARALTADVWSTVVGLHSGDAATLFGISPGAQVLNWLDGDGAVGAKGLTLHATAAGKATASLTLAGFSMADMASGKITTSFGHNDSGEYLYVHAT